MGLIFRLLLLFLVGTEAWLLTYDAPNADSYMRPILLLSISVLIAVVYFLIVLQRATTPEKPKTHNWLIPIQISCFALLSFFCFQKLHIIIAAYPVSAYNPVPSDIIPIIMQTVKHFVSGQWAYQPAVFEGYAVPPTYLPMMWLPYSANEWLAIDYRYTPAAVFWFASLCWLLFMTRSKAQHQPLFSLFASLAPMLIWYAVADADPLVISRTVEGLPAGYYLVLCLAIATKRPIAIALALSCCLLSRYSLVLCLPLPMLAMLWTGNGRALSSVVITTLCCILIIYWLPFLRKDSSIFWAGYNYYTEATVFEWTHRMDIHLQNGIGFSAWMARLHPGWTPEDLVSRYKKIHLLAGLGVTALLTLIFFIRRKSWEPYSFLLAALKIYLAVFYAFVQVPYKYLMLIPMAVSCALLAHASTLAKKPAPNSTP